MSLFVTTLDATVLRRTFGCFPSGVTAVCAMAADGPVGMAVSSFIPVSLDPPLVSVCVGDRSRTWARLRTADRLGVSVLNEEQHAACRQLSALDGDRFAGIRWFGTPGGAVLIGDAAASLECALEGELPAGDHRIALLRIHAVQSAPEVAPLVFHGSRFRRLAS
ncbi:flavin reductase family protein [Kitasatospora sp. NPDC051170]|uniref:flavin reductase family protein n=1 Tax=Kitasatospora sp. NPDC051170 TaxID=3364056 RepID=UPI00378EBADD